MNIRNRIFFFFILIIGLAMFGFTRWLSDDLKSRYSEAIEEPLVDVANILAESIGSQLLAGDLDGAQLKQFFDRVYARRFKAQIFRLEKNNVDMMVYVTDADGRVVFHSLDESAIGQDYSRWNDVILTLGGEYGARSSFSSGIQAGDEDAAVTIFVAAPIVQQERIIGVVSVGKPKDNIRRFLDLARRDQRFAAIVALVSTLLLGFVIYRWMSQPLDRLANFADRVSRGERIEPPDLGRNEIGDVCRAVQSMREALEGKEYTERYVQTLTHELKSPLSAIRGAVELLDEEVPPEQRQQFYKNIRAEALRMQDLVERMLQLASLEKRRRLEEVEDIDLGELLEQVRQDYQVECLSRNLEIRFTRSDTVMVRGERFLLRQAVSNLVQNAVDFSPNGGEIGIDCRVVDSFIEVDVIDQGEGIPDYAWNRIFERFYSLPRPGGGQKSTGLGLNFVKEAIELHGGSVSIERNDANTRARIRLPA
ncbi:MAG: two-component system sensor histidine kinase CreC [Gammaproteobacteria bacterium]|nr:two-component system sensor histidine kinase CreC [Gammaproteobacteria bacterium]